MAADGDLDDGQHDDLFWETSPQHRRTVAIGLARVFDELKLTAGDVQKTIALCGHQVTPRVLNHLARAGREMVASTAPAGRSARKGRLQTPRTFTGILAGLLRILRGGPARTKLRGLLPELKRVEAALLASKGERSARGAGAAPPTPPPPQSAEAPPAVEADIATVVTLIARLIGTKVDEFANIRRVFFTERELADGGLDKHFVCYRFHSKPKKVVKSFFVFKAPRNGIPVCSFTHVFCETPTSPPRVSRGVIIPSQTFMYCLGPMHHHEAIKVILLRRRVPGDTYTGLTLSMDEDGSPIAARVLLMRCSARRHEDANLGIFDVADLREELGGDLEKLRNRVPFELESINPVLFQDKPVSQRRMVSETFNHLKDAQGQPLFTTADGQEFNPADEDHYTYNSALKLWSPD